MLRRSTLVFTALFVGGLGAGVLLTGCPKKPIIVPKKDVIVIPPIDSIAVTTKDSGMVFRAANEVESWVTLAGDEVLVQPTIEGYCALEQRIDPRPWIVSVTAEDGTRADFENGRYSLLPYVGYRIGVQLNGTTVIPTAQLFRPERVEWTFTYGNDGLRIVVALKSPVNTPCSSYSPG